MPKRFSKIRRRRSIKIKSRKRSRRRSRRSRKSRRRSRRKNNLDGGDSGEKNIVIIKAPFNCSACDKAIKLSNAAIQSKKATTLNIYTEQGLEYTSKYENLLNNYLDNNMTKEQAESWGNCIGSMVSGKKIYKCYPKVFINDQFIGGCKNLEEHLK